MISITVTCGTGAYSGPAAGFHICGRVADEKAVRRPGAKDLEGFEDYVGCGLRRESIRSLDMIEVRQQAEHFENDSGSESSFGRCRRFMTLESGESFEDARVEASGCVVSQRIRSAVFADESVHLFRRIIREKILEKIEQVAANIRAEESVRNIVP